MVRMSDAPRFVSLLAARNMQSEPKIICDSLLCAPQNNLSTVNCSLDQNTITTKRLRLRLRLGLRLQIRFTNIYHILHTANATTSAGHRDWYPLSLSHPRTTDGQWHRWPCPQPQQSPETATRCRLPVPAVAGVALCASGPAHLVDEHAICCCCCHRVATLAWRHSSAAVVATDSSPE